MRCRASGCLRKSIPLSFLNSSRIQSMIRPSQSSPPRWVSPLVALTSNTPSPISSTEISNVPPPRSYTAIFSSFFLSSPYASDAAVGSLTMRVGEVGGNGDDRLCDFLAEERFRVGLHLGEDHRGNFGRRERLCLPAN